MQLMPCQHHRNHKIPQLNGIREAVISKLELGIIHALNQNYLKLFLHSNRQHKLHRAFVLSSRHLFALPPEHCGSIHLVNNRIPRHGLLLLPPAPPLRHPRGA